MNIEITYDGEYPNLCRGHLFVTIDGKTWDFGKYCLSSGGSVSFTPEWTEIVDSGPWHVSCWPENFPEDIKAAVEYEINKEIPAGCCGGCV